jgi:hypothetical protein
MYSNPIGKYYVPSIVDDLCFSMKDIFFHLYMEGYNNLLRELWIHFLIN